MPTLAVPRMIGPSNGYLPQATGRAIAYVKDPRNFAFTNYCEFIETPVVDFSYPILDPDFHVRAVDLDDDVWNPGDDRPRGDGNHWRYKWLSARCQRRNVAYRTAYEVFQQPAPVDPRAYYDSGILVQSMTRQARRLHRALINGWPTGRNKATANQLNGGAGPWDLGNVDGASGSFRAINKTIMEAVRLIAMGTNDEVTPDKLMMIMNPLTALRISNTPELVDLFKLNQGAQLITGNDPQTAAKWNLPATIGGVRVLVDGTTFVSSRIREATPQNPNPYAVIGVDRVYSLPDDAVWILSRVGGIDGKFGIPSFSTLQTYYFKYLKSVESFDEPVHKRFSSNIVDYCVELLVAPESGYYITDIFSD